MNMMHMEREVLGECLIDEKAVDVALEMLTADDFTGEHKDIFNAIKALREAGKAVDAIGVSSKYKNYEYLFALGNEIATTRLIRSHCEMLHEATIKKLLHGKVTELTHGMGDMSLLEIKGKMNDISNRIETDDIEGDIRDLDVRPYVGYAKTMNKFIPTGMKKIDHAIDCLTGGLVTLVAGRNNGGKTTFCNQIICNAIDKGFKVLVVNGEEKQDVTINKLYTAIIGREEIYYNLIKPNLRTIKEPKDITLRALKRWHAGKLKVFSKSESNVKSTDQMLYKLEQELSDNQQDLLVVDNLMSLLSNVTDSEKNGMQAKFMQSLCDMAKTYNVHIILVLHPNKTYRKGEELESEQLSGTSDLANKADNIITVVREYKEDVKEVGVDGYIKVQKNRRFSNLPQIETHFDETTGMLLEIDDDGNYVSYGFKWKEYLDDTVAPWDD